MNEKDRQRLIELIDMAMEEVGKSLSDSDIVEIARNLTQQINNTIKNETNHHGMNRNESVIYGTALAVAIKKKFNPDDIHNDFNPVSLFVAVRPLINFLSNFNADMIRANGLYPDDEDIPDPIDILGPIIGMALCDTFDVGLADLDKETPRNGESVH